MGGTGPPSPVCVARMTAYAITLPRCSSTANERTGTDLRHEVELVPPPAEGDPCVFMQAWLGALDAPVDPRYGLLEERLWPPGATALRHDTPALYGSGSRVLAAVDCEIGALGAPLRLDARRLTLP